MTNGPPLRALHAFEAAARHGSFKAAAVELGVVPTAISHQVRLLEEICGRKLFQRRPRPLVLTSAGARLFPILRNGFDLLAGSLTAVAEPDPQAPLRVTSPNAFASRWLVPRLEKWREANPAAVPLEIIGTDTVLDLRAGAADVAIRYTRSPPLGLAAQEICRDSFFPVCSPRLLAGDKRENKRAADLLRYPLIHFDWMNRDPEAPTWRRWLATARSIDPELTADKAWDLSFREELHAIDAVVAGQGIAICSDVVVGRELDNGTLVKAHPLSLPGYSFYVVWMQHSPRSAVIESFLAWMRTVA
ncbi:MULTISPECIES: LysR substrate-binding domain-containing protein [unclassified Mesorhizobium]|uniref:LysR substrate-binding domain-containing protein n=1 Tax=unclassified Mesorhizobium TaxID=325217 RepID=UPI001CCB412C|nr:MULTISPECIES: LysR substrate-binding domain-containing protein [unclassified Mesorhizobium]MBZ9683869.1 LysR family transcriptional regulator [Mesorhizobium sp. CO1-1-2]MBZ9696605.1 LysR family transcriptional regulator [Mesorhizobium sp. CO1-1-9]MBZ9725404.1 LysR family transcriptional regulator [Mesorhizobium sp. CO1-1-11]MBZ9923661.1 LysR family transcriptional regulator [Mesorhizobium sp. BR1-1-4]